MREILLLWPQDLLLISQANITRNARWASKSARNETEEGALGLCEELVNENVGDIDHSADFGPRHDSITNPALSSMSSQINLFMLGTMCLKVSLWC